MTNKEIKPSTYRTPSEWEAEMKRMAKEYQDKVRQQLEKEVEDEKLQRINNSN